MKKTNPPQKINRPLTKKDLMDVFYQMDQELLRQQAKPIKALIVGGCAMIMLNLIERSTYDIDLAPVMDAMTFRELAHQFGFIADIVTVSTTVDFNDFAPIQVFKGPCLMIEAVPPEFLMKMKLERFRKQDPQDIDAIIKKQQLDYQTYKSMVVEAAKDFVGNPRPFALSILQVAENHYTSEQVTDLAKTLHFYD